jgi:hypothetical protein
MCTQEKTFQKSSYVHTKRKKGTSSDQTKYIDISSSSTSSMETEEEEEPMTNYRQENKREKGKQPINTRKQGKRPAEMDPWTKVINMLDTINSRLTKLESGRSNNKKFQYSS